MKNLNLLLLILVFSLNKIDAQEFQNQTLIFSPQSQIDGFSKNCHDCSQLLMDVRIEENISGNITSLDSLYPIIHLSGSLLIHSNESLVSLIGLHNLKTIEKTLHISNNSALSYLSGLKNINSLGAAVFSDNGKKLYLSDLNVQIQEDASFKSEKRKSRQIELINKSKLNSQFLFAVGDSSVSSFYSNLDNGSIDQINLKYLDIKSISGNKTSIMKYTLLGGIVGTTAGVVGGFASGDGAINSASDNALIGGVTFGIIGVAAGLTTGIIRRLIGSKVNINGDYVSFKKQKEKLIKL